MNVTKYPPSLLFCSVTLGIMFLILGFAEKARNQLVSMVSVYGRVPMFYFLAHFYLIHAALLVVLSLQGFSWTDMSFATGSFGRPQGVDSGIGLGGIYLLWMGVVLVLYKPCLAFGSYKASSKQWWVKYI